MSRIPNDITGGGSGRPGLVTPGGVGTDPSVGVGAISRGLEQLGQTGFLIAQSVAQRKAIERDAAAISAAEDAYLEFEQDNVNVPEDSFETAQFKFDEIHNANENPQTRARLDAIRRRSLRLLGQKQSQATVSAFRSEIELVTHENDIEVDIERVRRNGSIDTSTKDVVEREFRIAYSDAINGQAIARMSEMDSAEDMVEVMNIALEAGREASRTRKQIVEEVIVPVMRATAIGARNDGDLEKIRALGMMTTGTVPDELARQTAIARRNVESNRIAGALVEDFVSGGESGFRLPTSREGLDEAYKQLAALGEANPDIARYFVQKGGNLPDAMIKAMKSNLEEGGADNLTDVFNTITAISQSGRNGVQLAGSTARNLGDKAVVMYEMGQVKNPQEMQAAIGVLSDQRAGDLLNTARLMLTGRKENKLTGQDEVKGIGIQGRINDSKVELSGRIDAGDLQLTASQRRLAQSLFMFHAVSRSMARDVSSLEEMAAMNDVFVRDALNDMTQSFVDLSTGIKLGPGSLLGLFVEERKTVLASSGLLGIGDINQQVTGRRVELMRLMRKHQSLLGSDTPMPQIASTDGKTTYIPYVNKEGDIGDILAWDPAKGEGRLVTDEREHQVARELINGTLQPGDLDPLSGVRYTPDMGDISFREANEISKGRLMREVDRIAERQIILRIGRPPDLSPGSEERQMFIRARNRFIVDVLKYPRLQDAQTNPE